MQTRFGSFVIGAMLAIKFLHISHRHDHKDKFKKYTILDFIFVHLLLIATKNIGSPLPSDTALQLLLASSRQLFAIGQASILFTTLSIFACVSCTMNKTISYKLHMGFHFKIELFSIFYTLVISI